MKNTMTDLVAELGKLTQSVYIEELGRKAKAGEFHDYRSNAVCGKVYATQCIDHVFMHDHLITQSDRGALEIIRQDIVDGEYDEPFTKEDQDHVFKEIDEDPNVSERDRTFFKAMMELPKEKKNRGGFGKKYY